MIRTRTFRRSWWTACSPHSEECVGPNVELAIRAEGDPSPAPDAARLGLVVTTTPSTYRDGILKALQGGPKTFTGLAAEVLNLPGADVVGTSFEFALWALVEAGCVKFSPESPPKFALWFSVCDPDFETAHDRALAARFD